MYLVPKKTKYISLFIVCALFFTVSSTVSAQSLGAVMNIDVSPQNPKPGETMSATISSYDINLETASIEWYKNGSLLKSGRGVTSVTFPASGLGVKTTIDVAAMGSDGRIARQTVSITPTQLDLLWQTDAYVPPFYRGKPLYTNQANITFIALPQFSGISAKNLVYTWRNNNTVQGPDSGYGKNKLSRVGSIIARPFDIQVTAATSDESISASKRVVVNSVKPSILIYEKNPLYGIFFNKIIASEMNLPSEEFTLSAFPLFMSGVKSALTYNWTMNAAAVSANAGRSSITLRNTGGEGKSVVGLMVQNPQALLQSADARTVVNFSPLINSRF